MVALAGPTADAGLVSTVRPAWFPRATLVVGWLAIGAGCVDLAVNGFDGSAIRFVAAALLMSASMVVIRRQPELRLAGWFAVMTGILAVGFVLPSLLRWAVDSAASDRLVFVGAVACGFANVGATIAALRVVALFPDGRYLDRIDRAALRAT